MIRRPPRSTQSRSSAASDVYKRQGVGGEEVLRCPAVDGRAEPDADQQVGPDLAQDRADLLDADLDAVVPAQAEGRVDQLTAQAGLEDERLDPALDLEPAEHEARD